MLALFSVAVVIWFVPICMIWLVALLSIINLAYVCDVVNAFVSLFGLLAS